MKYNYFRLSPRQEFNDIIADYSARNGYFDNFKPVITQADIIQKNHVLITIVYLYSS